MTNDDVTQYLNDIASAMQTVVDQEDTWLNANASQYTPDQLNAMSDDISQTREFLGDVPALILNVALQADQDALKNIAQGTSDLKTSLASIEGVERSFQFVGIFVPAGLKAFTSLTKGDIVDAAQAISDGITSWNKVTAPAAPPAGGGGGLAAQAGGGAGPPPVGGAPPSMRAAVFVRTASAFGFGHVGWAFDVSTVATDCGAVEDPLGMPSCDPARMGFWQETVPDPIVPMTARTYNDLKVLNIVNADPAAALSTALWVAQQTYTVIGRNCMDDVYDVLRSFGVQNLPPPVWNWAPDEFFNRVTAPSSPVAGYQWRPFVPAQSQFLASVSTMGGAVITAKAPAWRQVGTPEWHGLQADLAAASGVLHLQSAAARARIVPFAPLPRATP